MSDRATSMKKIQTPRRSRTGNGLSGDFLLEEMQQIAAIWQRTFDPEAPSGGQLPACGVANTAYAWLFAANLCPEGGSNIGAVKSAQALTPGTT